MDKQEYNPFLLTAYEEMVENYQTPNIEQLLFIIYYSENKVIRAEALQLFLRLHGFIAQ